MDEHEKHESAEDEEEEAGTDEDASVEELDLS